MRTISKADLHLHTEASDGTASARDVLERSAARGLRVIAITDHDTIAGALEARRLALRFGVDVIVGEEVSTTEGHLLALFIEETVPPGRPAAETIAAVHAQGGLAIAAHPYDWAVSSLGKAGLRRRSLGPRRGEWPLDAIEGLNAGVTWPGTLANTRARRVAQELGLPVVAGSDAHTLATVGQAYTLFPGTTAGDVRRAIIEGEVTVAGRGWSVAQKLDFVRRIVRLRGLRGTLALAWSNRAAPSLPEGRAIPAAPDPALPSVMRASGLRAVDGWRRSA